MIKRIAHISIAVKNLDLSKELFSKLFGNDFPRTEKVEEQNAMVSFYPVGQSSVELIEAIDSSGAGSAITDFIGKRGEGLHHICLEVDDIEKEIQRLTNLGFRFASKAPFLGGGGCRVAFMHPKSTNGVLIELSQPIESTKP
ncbi:MAG: methylmalonyl-CoA epimerase [Bacteroidota bacterium]